MIDDKNTAGYVWCFDDLTELRVLERQMRQKEQMAAIGVMSAGIAHEIRNPLASITGSFNLLQSDLDSEFGPAPAGRNHHAGNRTPESDHYGIS